MIDKYLDIKSIDPKYWGKSGWIFLNSIAITYDPIYKENYREFILQLPYILPCKTCGDNLKNKIYLLDYALESKENFISWLIDVRNDIYVYNKTDWKQKNLKQTLDEIFYSEDKNSILYYQIFIFILILIFLIFILKNNI